MPTVRPPGRRTADTVPLAVRRSHASPAAAGPPHCSGKLLRVPRRPRHFPVSHRGVARYRRERTPVAVVNGPFSIDEGAKVLWSSEGSYDPEGAKLTRRWEFHDGTTATALSVTKKYDRSGAFAVRLVVKDGSGQADTATTTVTVRNLQPKLQLKAPDSVTEGYNGYTIRVIASDPGGPNLNLWYDCGTWQGYQSVGSFDGSRNFFCEDAPDEGRVTVLAKVTDVEGQTVEVSRRIKILPSEPRWCPTSTEWRSDGLARSSALRRSLRPVFRCGLRVDVSSSANPPHARLRCVAGTARHQSARDDQVFFCGRRAGRFVPG
jgi:hypothetical protein